MKYDVLTCLSVAGLNDCQRVQTSMFRLIALLTARYNWHKDEICVGQREMARMWSVNERTVKREMKRLTETGVLIRHRAGVRGRVGAYRLNLRRVMELSEPSWALVGPDFEARMRERYGMSSSHKVVALADHAPLRDTPELMVRETDTPWLRAMADLAHDHPGLYQSWFQRLTFASLEAGTLTLDAPSRFVQRYIEANLMRQLEAATGPHMGVVHKVVFTVSAPG